MVMVVTWNRAATDLVVQVRASILFNRFDVIIILLPIPCHGVIEIALVVEINRRLRVACHAMPTLTALVLIIVIWTMVVAIGWRPIIGGDNGLLAADQAFEDRASGVMDSSPFAFRRGCAVAFGHIIY